jgi:hypothetical protein
VIGVTGDKSRERRASSPEQAKAISRLAIEPLGPGS